jgi:MFS family permease
MSAHLNATGARVAQDTRWRYVALLLAAGIGAAMQVGKVPAALPVLQRDLHLTLIAAAWIMSLFSVVGAAFGCLAGSFADHIGARTTTVAGLACMALASALGSVASNPAPLLASRALEGMGFVVAVVAIPSLLLASADERDRRLVPALWGTYMPIGTAIALASAPAVLYFSGWRLLWRLNAVVLLGFALALVAIRPPSLRSERRTTSLAHLRAVLFRAGPVRLALVFACYTFQYAPVMGFLPTLLTRLDFAPRNSGALTAAAVLTNAVGNLAASWLIQRRIAPRALIACACIAMSVAAVGIFTAALAPLARYFCSVGFFAFAGLVPASIFASVPTATPDRSSSATTMGLVVQASHMGQLIGPPAVAAVAGFGWQLAPAVLVPAALTALLVARTLEPAR